MPVDDAALADPCIEQRRPPGQEPRGQPFGLADDGWVERLARRQGRLYRPGLLDVVRPAAAQRVPAALLGDLRAAGRLGVLGGEDPRHLAQWPGHRLVRADQRGQPPGCWHAAHHDQVIADLAVRAAELGHAQVHAGREPEVQLGLAGAGHRAGRQGAEVQEAEIDRLVQVAGQVTGEEHRGSMGLGHLGPRLVPRPARRRPFRFAHRHHSCVVTFPPGCSRTARGVGHAAACRPSQLLTAPGASAAPTWECPPRGTLARSRTAGGRGVRRRCGGRSHPRASR